MSGWAPPKSKRETSVSVWATHQFAALHHWPGASGHRGYLSQPHRHLFIVRAEVDVTHDNREVEFHDLRDVVEDACSKLGDRADSAGRWAVQNLGAMSCEMIAAAVFSAVDEHWPGRRIRINASEDGEFGAEVVCAD